MPVQVTAFFLMRVFSCFPAFLKI
ncbi:hypothetical protein RO1_12320 [Roseburia intestinalis XB6B4]|uniref:Uncharacterized protein n=1 Tax=Roseburia intestinalis XB6B4 TaxID=718255 RepID=D4KWY1_9FIRM|nr:hypothetical protein RO1_12320 [Roseburia intestinalis XB6B4]